MISLEEIQKFYPENLHPRKQFLLREYLQYKILSFIFESPYASKFIFLGGSCLRIIHNNQRFSEDIDFDNLDLTEEDFEQVSQIIKTRLEREGYEVTMRNVFRGTYHCYIRFPALLYKTGISPHKEARVLIKLDTQAQNFEFTPNTPVLSKFDIYGAILSTPLDILLSQKFVAISGRKRPKGRDFYDIVFLLSRTQPNYDFLEKKLNITTPQALKAYTLKICENLDFMALAEEVEPFLFQEEDKKLVLLFKNYIEQNLNDA